MLHLKRILVPTDFSACAEQALAHAEYLAERHRAQLHLLHVTTVFEEDPLRPSSDMTSDVLTEVRHLVEKRLKADEERHHRAGIDVLTVQERAISVAPSIVAYAAQNDMDLIVAGTHGRRGLGHVLLGSVSEELIRQAPCPVLIIREQKEIKPADERIRRILAPVDFSEYAHMALVHARELAGFYSAELDVLHVIEEAVHPHFYHSGTRSTYEAIPDLESRSRSELQQLIDSSPGPDVPIHLHVVHGMAVRTIHAFALQAETDLIVMATHGLTGLNQLLIGSVTARVARRTTCPLLAVKSFGRSLVEPLDHQAIE